MSAFDEVNEVFTEIAAENPNLGEQLAEALPRVQAMLQLEDRGWLEMTSGVTGNSDVEGPDMDLIKEASNTAREMVHGSPMISRGLDLRTSYVWSKGIVLEDASPESSTDSKRGRKSKKEKFLTDNKIQRYVLGPEAHKDMEAAAFTDGHFFFLGDDRKRTGHPIPLSEIDMVYLDPEYAGEVLAYRRNYKEYKTDGNTVQHIVWYYVDTHTGDRKNPQGSEQRDNNVTIRVDTEKTLFVKSFNSMIGWPLGVPDSLTALKWARLYAEMVNDGKVVSKANAKFVYKVKNSGPKGATNAAAKASSAPGVGNVASLGNNNDLISIPQANRSYDFNGLRPIAAQAATAMNVSVIHLLSDPGAAGSSYGSASNLDLPTKRAMVSRQSEWVGFLERILKWGTDRDIKVSFPSLDDPDPYREMQLVTMGWNSGTIHPEEMRARTIQIGQFTPDKTKSPQGIMIPNNSKSLNRADIDNDSAGDSSSGSVASTASSPDQGKTNNTGGVSDSAAKDLRNESMDAFTANMLMERMEEISRQLEALGLNRTQED